MTMSLTAAGSPRLGALRLGRYLPVSVAVTAAVTVLPLVAVAQLGRAGSPLALALHVLAAMAMSILIARVLAAAWTRHERSNDLVFGDLLLWGWVRRALAERRLERASRDLAKPTATGDAHADLLRRMSSLLEARDPYTHGHSRRVARHSERIARELGLRPEEVAKIRAAALVHDIGKINVPRPILTKPDRLTEEEFALVKRHPGDGAAMVAALGDSELTAIVRSHHERIDGTGYPDGLAGADIPLGARIIAVADTFDAITSTRPYRDPRTHKQALDVLRGEAGTQLDAAAVTAFASYYSAHRSVGWVSVLVAAPQRLLTGFGGISSGFGASVAPLAQTACGIGGIALVGVCLGGSPLPAGSVDREAAVKSGSQRQVVADANAGRADGRGGATKQPGSHPQPQKNGAHVRGDGSSATPGDTVSTPPALRAPPSDGSSKGGQSGSGSGSGAVGGAAGGAVDDVTDTPPSLLPVVLPDPGEVVEGVTDQLPDVQTPAPLPPVALP
jgi:putative nucleotidyltransferase with HDIG domain